MAENPVTDLDGRVAPSIELIYERGTPAFRSQWLDIERQLVLARPRADAGDWASPYLSLEDDRSIRARGRAERGETTVEAGVLQDNASARLRALDAAGVAVQLLNPMGSVDACFDLPPNLAVGMLGAYNRYLTTYCEADPARLKAVIQVHGSDPQWSANEIVELAADPAVAAVTVFLPIKVAPDSGSFAQIWEALEETGLPLVCRPEIAIRAWTPQRLLTYLDLSDVLERRPGVKLAFVGGGSGWLDAWLRSTQRSERAAARAADLLERQRVFAVLDRLPASGAASPQAERHEGCLLWGSRFPVAHGPGGEVVVPELEPPRRDRLLRANPAAFLA